MQGSGMRFDAGSVICRCHISGAGRLESRMIGNPSHIWTAIGNEELYDFWLIEKKITNFQGVTNGTSMVELLNHVSRFAAQQPSCRN